MAAIAEDRWQPFGADRSGWDGVPERDGVRVAVVKFGGGPGGMAGRWLAGAAGVLALLAAAAAAVSWQAQYQMVWRVKQAAVVSAIEAGIPDAGALVFAALGIALALHGRRALRPRALNAACIGISLVMNALAAAPGWRDLAIWVMPSAVYALASDTLIGVVRAWVLARQRGSGETLAEDGPTPLALAGGLALWLLRLALAPRSTLAGFRSWVVKDCPAAPGVRPGQAAELQAVRLEAAERVALAASQRDEAIERAAAEARQARDEAAQARTAEAVIREELDRARAEAGQAAARALAAAEREREALRAWSQRQADELRGELQQVRADAARLVCQARDGAAARIAALEQVNAGLRAERDRLAASLQMGGPPPRGARRQGTAPARQARPRGDRPTKRDQMIELAGQRSDLAAVPLAQVPRLAGEVAAEIGYSPGTARRELRRHVLGLRAAPADEGEGGGADG